MLRFIGKLLLVAAVVVGIGSIAQYFDVSPYRVSSVIFSAPVLILLVIVIGIGAALWDAIRARLK